MKQITCLFPKSEFTSEQIQKLGFAGQVSFIDIVKENDLEEMIRLSKHADILAFPADKLGKSAPLWLSTILEATPTIKAVALDTTEALCIDREYCKSHEITVTTVPDCTNESVAEHILGLMIASAKRILLNDRRTYRRKYQPERGIELRNKNLGIIGVNATGERVATLAKAFGMTVKLFNIEPIRMQGMERSSLNEVNLYSDFIVLLLPETEANKKFLSKEIIFKLKDSCSVINLSGRGLVDEYGMSHALQTGQVSSYIFESESMKHSPLEGIETAIMLKPFSRLTTDALRFNRDWVSKNVLGLSANRPHHKVIL